MRVLVIIAIVVNLFLAQEFLSQYNDATCKGYELWPLRVVPMGFFLMSVFGVVSGFISTLKPDKR